MKETELIKKYFSPLAKNFSDALNLEDDAAKLKNYKNNNYIISVDNFIQGVHCPIFLSEKLIALRAIFCATSDLAAMGVSPYCIFLSISNPKKKSSFVIKKLVRGIKQAINTLGIKVAGGDLTSYDGPIAINVTAVGKRNKNEKILLRKGGRENDCLAVTGLIGEAFIGLKLLEEKIKTSYKLNKKRAIDSFIYPPQLHEFSKKLVNYANCCIDISDGLIGDVGKLGAYSNCCAILSSKNIPLSKLAKSLLENRLFSLKELLTAGDDYQLAFSFDKKNLTNIKKLSKSYNLKISVIGHLKKGKGVYVDKKIIAGGYSHI